MHVIEQFNGGVYDTIIASDEKIMDQHDDISNDSNSHKKNKESKKLETNFYYILF